MDRRGGGWVVFAAIVLGVAGVMRVFDAIWAFSYHGVLPDNLQGAIFGHSLKTYGWVYLVVAVVLLLCGFLVLSGSQVGRWVGIAAGAIGCISAIWWMPWPTAPYQSARTLCARSRKCKATRRFCCFA